MNERRWRTLMLTALPIGIGVGILAFDSVWWGVAIGWGLVVLFLIGYIVAKSRS